MIENLYYILFSISADTLSTSAKLRAIGRLNGRRAGMADYRIFIAGLVLVGALLTFLYLYRKSRRWKEEERSRALFEKNVERLALDSEERQLLIDIARYSKLRKIDAIFTSSELFDLGAAGAMKESFSQGKTLLERKHLNQEIVSLKEKLGFKETPVFYKNNEYTFKPKGLSSRQLPIGRNVLISRTNSKNAYPMTATVTGNDEYELKLETDTEFPGKPGEVWRFLYQLGALVWKFDSLVVNCEKNEIIFSHTENIRFINRRKFVHAPVDMYGYIARFPCAKTLGDQNRDMVPQFISVKVVELSGPSIKIIAPLKVRTGQRLLVIFALTASRVVQSTADVRRCENEDDGYSIVCELIGVSESCINELVAATNDAVRGLAAKEQEEIELQKHIEEQMSQNE